MSSRRKQGRPQQRKALDSLEQENDLLVCGDCQTSFPLHDIVQFIKHKNHSCNKENVDQCTPSVDDSAMDDPDGPTDLSNPSSSKSSGYPRKEMGESWTSCERGTPGSRDGAASVHSLEMRDDRRERIPLRQKQVVDAEANTTHSEPSKFVCDTCRLTLSSAWALLQHAQKEHSMKIYNTGTSAPTPPASQGPTPQPAHTHSSSLGPTPPITNSDLASPSPRPSMDHRTPPSSAGSGPGSPFPGGHPLNPFTPFRMPLDARLPPSPFNRHPGLDIPVDFLEHYRLRPHIATVAIGPSPNMEPHFAHAFDRSRPMSSFESQIYSQRLKQLANPTLPHSLISPISAVPFSQPAVLTPIQPGERVSRGGRESAGSGRDSTGGVEPDRERADSRGAVSAADSLGSSAVFAPGLASSSLSTLPNKLKSCEFCGKMFRFQSNLIVHRRSHTGEKPFKCPVCPHACTQQSKLKRHMKTHSQRALANARHSLTSNPSSDGSVHSTCSTPDSTRNKMDEGYGLEDDDDDLDDDEEGEEEEEDMEDDFTDGELDSAGESNDGFHSLKGEGSRGKDLEVKCKENARNSQSSTPETERGPTPTQRSASASLISEVMKNTGLNSIQPYNEAFQAALAEKYSKDSNKALDRSHSKENGEGDTENENKSKRVHSSSLQESLFLGTTDLLGDRSVKREPGDVLTGLDMGSASSHFGRPSFHRWLPSDTSSSMRAFFPGFPPTFALQHDFARDSHNGYSAVTTASISVNDSALKVPGSLSVIAGMSKPGTSSASSLLTSSSSSPAVIPRKDRRNDTCEFCGKVFKNCSNLTVHRRSHTGEKPYKCSLCNYACAQSSKLTRHMKTHGRIGKDVLKCKFCNMPFSVPSTLEKHMRKCVESRNARILAEQDNGESNSASASSLPNQSTPPQSHDDVSLDKGLERSRSMKHEPSWSY